MSTWERNGRVSRTSSRMAEFFLHVSRISRFWPVRSFTEQRVRRLGGQRYTLDGYAGVKIDVLRFQSCRNDQRKLPVLFTHGWIETKEFHLSEARMLTNAGHDVIMMDLRRHGHSTGHCVTFGVLEKLDVAAVIDAVQQRGWIGDRLITIGYSLGAATMLQHAVLDPRVAAVVALAPFNNFIEAIKSFHKAHRPPFSQAFLLRGFEDACARLGFDIHQASTLAAVERLHVPTLFIVGSNDVLLPEPLHTRVLAVAKKNGSCEYLQIPGAGHISLCLKRWPELRGRIIQFCDQVTQSVSGGVSVDITSRDTRRQTAEHFVAARSSEGGEPV